jgi:hypothetical protein
LLCDDHNSLQIWINNSFNVDEKAVSGFGAPTVDRLEAGYHIICFCLSIDDDD